MIKPKFFRSHDKFESFLFTAMGTAIVALVSCLADMVINDKASSDEVAKWVVDVTTGAIYSFPLNWVIIHNIEYVKYYFDDYLPWKERIKQRDAAHAARVLTVERATSEQFISELRKTK